MMTRYKFNSMLEKPLCFKEDLKGVFLFIDEHIYCLSFFILLYPGDNANHRMEEGNAIFFLY